MGLSKRGALFCSLLILVSCQSTKAQMSLKDEALLYRTLKNSALATNSDEWLSDTNVSLQTAVPRNLQHALAMYSDQFNKIKTHDYDFIQKMAFRILEQPIFEEDIEGQILSLFGADLASHPRLMPLFERALDSQVNIVQLAAIQALAKLPEDRANKLLVKGCSSPFLDVALTTCYILAQRKHPQAFELIESLMNKAPPECSELFPPILAMIDNPYATTKLKKCITSSQERVRLGAILSAATTARTELLPEIRSLSKQHNILQQEACAFALGELHDEASIETLNQLSNSPSDTVAIAALSALRKLGYSSSVTQLESYAQKGNIFAIGQLKDAQGDVNLLEALCHKNKLDNVSINAALALLRKKNPIALPQILALLIPENSNIFISEYTSPATTLSAKKMVLKNAAALRENPSLEQMSLAIRAQILSECTELPEDLFLKIASEIIRSNQNDLIPAVMHHMMLLKTDKSLALLKDWQQKVGSPYVRMWSNLALLKMNEPGPWREILLSFIKKEKYHKLVRIRGLSPWSKKNLPNQYEMNPFEISHLMMEIYLSIAEKQDDEGIMALLENLTNNDLKNKYAIAGLLILSTQ